MLSPLRKPLRKPASDLSCKMKTTLRTIATQYRQKTSACFEATDTTVHAKFTASRLLGPEEALQLVKDGERPRDIEQLPVWLKPIRD